MFHKKKYVIFLLVELLIPFLVFVGGIPAIFNYHSIVGSDVLSEYYSSRLEFFYGLAAVTTFLAIIAEFFIGIVSLILMLVNAFKNAATEKICRFLLYWNISGWCIGLTIMNKLIVQAFTYAQGV